MLLVQWSLFNSKIWFKNTSITEAEKTENSFSAHCSLCAPGAKYRQASCLFFVSVLLCLNEALRNIYVTVTSGYSVVVRVW